ncbi:MAG: hypothetical protein J2P17_15155 [Mycobacterium sp.]|nr:hypothetical protein [Mycobacterium sp.]
MAETQNAGELGEPAGGGALAWMFDAGPAPCPWAVAGRLPMGETRPDHIPPLLHNLHMHVGHRCATEDTLTWVCERRGYLPLGSYERYRSAANDN